MANPSVSNSTPFFTQAKTVQQGMLAEQILVQPSGESAPEPKWCYLLANHIKFSHRNGYNIHLPKPQEDELYAWLHKIIISGQTSVIFVQQLNLDKVRMQILQNLCAVYSVKLVNLNLGTTELNNVVAGPW